MPRTVSHGRVITQTRRLYAEDPEAITILLERKADYLSAWEIDFLRSLQGFSRITPKQIGILDTLWDDVFTGQREQRAEA